MTTLTDVESEILVQIAENLTTAENWDGDDELREALGDALDELAFIQDYFVVDTYVQLRADVGLYEYSLQDATPLYVRRAELVSEDRKLNPESLLSLSKFNDMFTVVRGSPYIYCCPSPGKLVVYPCYADDGGLVKLSVVACPSHYTAATGYLTIREELEDALIAYGKYHLLLRGGGAAQEALTEFDRYLAYAGDHLALSSHVEALKDYRMGN